MEFERKLSDDSILMKVKTMAAKTINGSDKEIIKVDRKV